MSILAEENSKPWLGAVFVTIAAGILYFVTAAHDIVVGDSPELIMAAVTLGVAHPPGYPLFTMLGHAFSLMPLGSIPFRVNLLSVICDSLAVGVVYLIAQRLTKSQIAAAVAALLLAVNPNFWAWSLAAEVFPLNNLLAAILILLLIAWHEEPARRNLLISAAFVFGLALTNHQTIVLLSPAICFLLWQRRATLLAQPRFIALCLIAIVIGLLPYAYIPWASSHHPVHNWGNVSSFHDLVALITRRNYGSTRLVTNVGYTGGPAWPRLFALIVSVGAVGGLLIIIGAVHAFRRARWYFWFCAIAFVFAGPVFIWITNLNLATAPSALFVLPRFFLLSQVALAPLVAFGVVAFAEFVARSTTVQPKRATRIVAATCFASIILSAATNYRRLDLSRNHIARQFAQDVFDTAPPNSIVLVTGDGLAFPLMYLQNVERAGADKTLVPIPQLMGEWYVRQVRDSHPELTIPFDRYDPQVNNLKRFVETNQNRVITVVGTAGNDHSLDYDYWPRQRGLLMQIERKSDNVTFETLLPENDELLGRVHPPSANAVRANTFEADILNVYAYPAFNVAASCERAGLKDAARTWYERALEINPHFSQARSALARLAQ